MILVAPHEFTAHRVEDSLRGSGRELRPFPSNRCMSASLAVLLFIMVPLTMVLLSVLHPGVLRRAMLSGMQHDCS